MSFNDVLLKMDLNEKIKKINDLPPLELPTKEETLFSLSSLFIKFFKYLKSIFNI